MRYTLSYDPVTRIEGHLKIAIEVDTVAGVRQVVDARSAGQLYRGIEKVLVGRDPRDGQHITERICGVCPVAHGMAAVLAQDRAFGTSLPLNGLLLRNLVNGSNFVESHVLHFYLLCLPDFIAGPATPPWQADWDIDRRFSKAASDTLLAHYLEALTIRRKADQLTALFGGRSPHPPAYVGGGFTCTPRPDRIARFNGLLDEITTFIQNAYIPDVQQVAA
jgi:hydrogenase large subunit